MQASVHRYDAESQTGSVLLDDGLEVPFGRDAFWSSGLRLLRLGQRLSVEVADGASSSSGDDDGRRGVRVTSMWLPGI